MLKLSSMTAIIAAVFFTLSLSSCSQPTEEEQVIRSQSLIAEHNYSEAIILLKDVLVKNKNNDTARSSLADAYFKIGDFVQAEKELLRISDLRKNTPKEQELLLQSIYFQQDGNQILNVELDSNASDLSKVLKAFVMLSSTDEYNEVVSQVVNDLKSESSKLLLEGLVSYSLGNFTEASKVLKRLSDQEAFFPFVNVINGLAHFQAGHYESAIEQYNLILKSSVNFDLVKLYKSEALIQSTKYDEAKVILSQLASKYENQPVISKLLGLINYAEEDYVGAKRNSELAITYGLSDSTVRGVAAISSMSIGNYEVAYQHFQTIGGDIELEPSLNAAFLYTKLKLGYETEVAQTLLRSGNGVGAFPEITASTIENLLSNQKFDAAEELEQLVIEQGLDTDINIANALVKMGNLSAIKTLERELKNTPNQESLFTLVSYYFNSGDFVKAKTLSLDYLKTEPNSLTALSSLMLSHANLDEKEEALAIAYKMKALKKNEAISANYIAMHEYESNNFELAYKTLSSALKENPLNISLLKSMRLINVQTDVPERSLPFFLEAYNLNGGAAYKFWYAQALTDAKSFDKVIELLRNHKFTAKTPRAGWVFLADAYTRDRQDQNAVDLLRSWVSLKPNDAFAYIKLLSQPQTKKLVPGIYNIVKEGLLRFKNNDLFSLLAVQYAIDRNDQTVAKNILTGISSEIKASPLYNNQYGRYLLLTKQYEQALPLLIGAYDSEPSFFHLSQVNNAYLGMLQTKSALEAIDTHLKRFPDDALARMLEADVLIWVNPDSAIKKYTALLKEYPKNAVAMNNIAWLQLEKGDVLQARTFAQQAVDLFPQNSNFLDTLAQTYLNERNYRAASSLLEIAIKNKPTDINIYFNYAEALYGIGQQNSAVKVLKDIQTDNPQLRAEIDLRIKKFL